MKLFEGKALNPPEPNGSFVFGLGYSIVAAEIGAVGAFPKGPSAKKSSIFPLNGSLAPAPSAEGVILAVGYDDFKKSSSSFCLDYINDFC